MLSQHVDKPVGLTAKSPLWKRALGLAPKDKRVQVVGVLIYRDYSTPGMHDIYLHERGKWRIGDSHIRFCEN